MLPYLFKVHVSMTFERQVLVPYTAKLSVQMKGAADEAVNSDKPELSLKVLQYLFH